MLAPGYLMRKKNNTGTNWPLLQGSHFKAQITEWKVFDRMAEVTDDESLSTRGPKSFEWNSFCIVHSSCLVAKVKLTP